MQLVSKVNLAIFDFNKHSTFQHSTFLIFWYYFTRQKARNKADKIWEICKIFPILHSSPCNNNYLLKITQIALYKNLKHILISKR